MIFISQESELKFDNICVLYFYASWVPFNKKMLLMMEKMERKYDKIDFFGIDIDNFRGLCKRFLIDSIPCAVIIDKKEIGRIEGLILTNAVRKYFSKVLTPIYKTNIESIKDSNIEEIEVLNE